VSSPQIRDLEFDDENEEKLARRDISPEDVLDMLAQPHILARNRRHRRGAYKIVGRDAGGRILTVILERTRIRNTWRPVTGWASSKAEKRMLSD